MVADRQAHEVRIFDREGRYLRSMGRSGEGPGEFRDLWKLWVMPGDTLWVGDYRPWRYNIFTARGEFVRQMNLKPEYLNPSRGGGVLDNRFTINARETWARKSDFSERRSFFVEVHDPIGNLTDGPIQMQGRRQGQISEGPPNYVTSELYDQSRMLMHWVPLSHLCMEAGRNSYSWTKSSV